MSTAREHSLGPAPGTLVVSRQSNPGLQDSPGSSVFDLPARAKPLVHLQDGPSTHPSSPSAPNAPPPVHTTSSLQNIYADADVKASTTLHESDQSDSALFSGGAKPSSPSFVLISGGTGGNAICSAFGTSCYYVLPVSDDGGSSSEIIRVLGGPSIGDIRSRLVRLIPPAPPSSPLDAIRRLLAYRLPTKCSEREARDEWRDIVEGHHSLWMGIPNDRKETIRGFLVYFESELLKRAHKNFDFRNGSIGNYFLAAAQGFFRSLPSAIFLFSSITNSQANILPVIVTNHTVTIAAELEDGGKLVGQCEISHPVSQAPAAIDIRVSDSDTEGMGELIPQHRNVMFEAEAKGNSEPLGSGISRLYYINAYGFEIHPSPNPDYLACLGSKDVLVYSCGSLWTSIIPCLALRGVSSAIARSSSLRAKILLLNAKNDRETNEYTAVDYISALVRTLNAPYSVPPYGLGNVNTTYPVSAFVTDLVYLRSSEVQVDVSAITRLGVRCTMLEGPETQFTVDNVRNAISKILTDEV